jgi:hypothetical protein
MPHAPNQIPDTPNRMPHAPNQIPDTPNRMPHAPNRLQASAYLVEKGLTDVNQLEGGIHRYLERYVDDGGYWIGKNYTFDKRFSHGANKCDVVSSCVLCEAPWERCVISRR